MLNNHGAARKYVASIPAPGSRRPPTSSWDKLTGSPWLGINQSHPLATPWERGSRRRASSASQMISIWSSPPFLTPFSQGAWGSSAQDGLSYPTQLNIWLGRAGPLYASSRCFGSRHILIAHTPGAGFLLSYVNHSGKRQLDGSEHAGCFF